MSERQATVAWLTREKSWPRRRIVTEYNLLRERFGRGRIDIVLVRPATRAERDKDPTSPGVFVGVVECKKAGAVLADHVRDQALRYADAVRATFVGVTNGQDFDTWAWEQKEKDYVPKQRFPTYRQMLQGESLPDEPEEDPFVRPTWVQLNNAAFLRQALEKYSEEFVCDKALDWIKRHAFDLYSLFRSPASVPDLPWTGYGVRILEDCGSNFKEFGNASGGSYPGYYRTLLVDEGRGTTHTSIHLGLFSVLSQRSDEKLNPKAVRTSLVVAVSDEERREEASRGTPP